jgi:hypothetical protein
MILRNLPLNRVPHIQECGEGYLDKFNRCVVCLHNHGRWRDDEWIVGDLYRFVPSVLQADSLHKLKESA